jgi:hypothetical protein
MASRYVVEHLNHLGIVAEVCREIGVAAWLDQQDPANWHDALFAQPLLLWAIRLYGLRPRVIRLDAGYWASA